MSTKVTFGLEYEESRSEASREAVFPFGIGNRKLKSLKKIGRISTGKIRREKLPRNSSDGAIECVSVGRAVP